MTIGAWIRKKPNAVLGATLLCLAGLAALVGQVHPLYDPIALDFQARLEPPSFAHPLGTDQFGRDISSRILAATGVSLIVALLTTFVAALLGTALGSIAGYFSGWVDRVIMTIMDAMLALPSLLLALAILSSLGPGKFGVVLALGFAYTPKVARVIRGAVLSIREQDFIDASRVMGNGNAYTIFRHVLPNCISPLIILCTTFFGLAILTESALSFLGIGVPPPYPSLGGMLSDSRSYLPIAPWLALYPGLAISVLLLGFNLFGDALRDRFDPRMEGL